MKTKIETKDLAKIINPFRDGVTYRDQQMTISQSVLDNYINSPNEHKLLEQSDDIKIDFYRNMALYIINNKENQFIHLDLNNSNPFNSGYMEFIKNIYTQTQYSYIQLDEVGENLNLINAKHLSDISEELNQSNQGFKTATDEPMNRLSTDILVAERVPSDEELELSREMEIAQIVDAVRNILNTSTIIQGSAFNKLVAQKKELINSDEVKITLLSKLGSNFVKMVSLNDIKDFSLDFTSPAIYSYVTESVKNNNFELFTYLFESYEEMQWQKKSFKEYLGNAQALENFDFKTIINLPSVIHHLKNHCTDYPHQLSALRKQFSISSCFKYLDPHNKEDETVIRAYMKRITPPRYNEDGTILDDLLFDVPLKYFSNKEFLSYGCSGFNYESLKKHLRNNNIEPGILSDPQFIVQNAELPANKLAGWIEVFLDKEHITKKFVLDILNTNEQFYKFLHSSLANYAKDPDIITLAVNNGLPFDDIKMEDMKDLLLKTTDSPQFGIIKASYVIHRNMIASELETNYPRVYEDSTERDIFREKYLKPEFAFLYLDEKSSDIRNLRKNTLSTFAEPKEVLEILDFIKENELDMIFSFDSSAFYAALSPELRKNKLIVENIAEIALFPYPELDETLRFNIDIALLYLNHSYSNVEHISPHFFNNINFILEYTKVMDRENYELNDTLLPSYVKNFFKEHEVEKNFHDYLSKYVMFRSMKSSVTEKKEEKPLKRMKI